MRIPMVALCGVIACAASPTASTHTPETPRVKQDRPKRPAGRSIACLSGCGGGTLTFGAAVVTIDVVQVGGGPVPGIPCTSSCSCLDDEQRVDEFCSAIAVRVGGVEARRTVHLPRRPDDRIVIRVQHDWHRPAAEPNRMPQPWEILDDRPREVVEARWSVSVAAGRGGPWDALRDGSFRLPAVECGGRVGADVARAEVGRWCARIGAILNLHTAHVSTRSSAAAPERPRCNMRGNAEIGGVSAMVAVMVAGDEEGDRGSLIVEGPDDRLWCGAVRMALVSAGALLAP